jgi:hypothetical protein
VSQHEEQECVLRENIRSLRQSISFGISTAQKIATFVWRRRLEFAHSIKSRRNERLSTHILRSEILFHQMPNIKGGDEADERVVREGFDCQWRYLLNFYAPGIYPECKMKMEQPF